MAARRDLIELLKKLADRMGGVVAASRAVVDAWWTDQTDVAFYDQNRTLLYRTLTEEVFR